MIIKNNIPALNTLRQNSVNIKNTTQALERLSSGLKINRAADDAAGLAISEKIRAQVGGLNRASENAQDGISLIQSADGALNEVHNVLHRMRELGIQAANDVNEQIDRQAIQNEVDQLVREIDRVANGTQFNRMTILDGSLNNDKYVKSVSGSNIAGLTLVGNPGVRVNGLTSISVQAGIKFDFNFDFGFPFNNAPYSANGVVQTIAAGTTLGITLSDDIASTAGLIPPVELAIAVNAGETAAVIAGNVRDALAVALGKDWTVTATGSSVNVAHNFVGEFTEGINIIASPSDLWEPNPGGEWATNPLTGNVTGTEGRDVIVRVDGEFADFSTVNVRGWENPPEEGGLRGRDTLLNLRHGDSALDPDVLAYHREQFTFRINDATVHSGAIISTRDGSELTLQVGANTGYDQAVRVGIQQLSSNALGISELSMFTHQEAQLAVSAIDIASQIVSNQRAALGAIQNRLEHTINNLDTVAENLQDAESRLRDADMAREMMMFTKNNILLQSSQAMSAQANNLPQGVLQLLR